LFVCLFGFLKFNLYFAIFYFHTIETKRNQTCWPDPSKTAYFTSKITFMTILFVSITIISIFLLKKYFFFSFWFEFPKKCFFLTICSLGFFPLPLKKKKIPNICFLFLFKPYIYAYHGNSLPLSSFLQFSIRSLQ